MLIDVVRVVAHPDFTLELEYANDERRHFDVTRLLTIAKTQDKLRSGDR